MWEAERKASGGKKKVLIPVPVLTYNASMDGVDLADQYHSYYPVGRPSVRWWHYLGWWLLQTAMVNSFVLFKNSNLPAQTTKGTVTSTFALKSWHHCARVALFVNDINTSLSPRLESLQLHL